MKTWFEMHCTFLLAEARLGKWGKSSTQQFLRGPGSGSVHGHRCGQHGLFIWFLFRKRMDLLSLDASVPFTVIFFFLVQQWNKEMKG